MAEAKVERITKELKCRLTDEEVLAAADDVQRLLSLIESIESDKKSYVSEAKSRIDKLTAELKVQCKLVQEKMAWRSVECEEIVDYDNDEYTITRLDTNEDVEKRPLTPLERQMTLPVQDEEPDEDPEGGDEAGEEEE